MTSPSPRPLTRRAVLLGGLGALGLAACSSNSDTVATDAGSADDVGPGTDTATTPLALAYGFPPSEFAVAGIDQRFPFLIADSEGVFLTEMVGPVTFTVTLAGETVVEGVEVEPHSNGVPRAYVPLRFTPPDPGIYDVVGSYDGQDMSANIQVVERDELALVQVGDPLPEVATPTFDDHRGVEPICTREPQCQLHDTDLTTALGSGQPVAVLVATPAYCSTTICGPVLDLFVEKSGAESLGDLVAIHAEVYADPEAVDNIVDATVAPTPTAFGLTYEPALVVADGNGLVVDRLDAVFDKTEIGEALAKALG